MPSYGVTIHDDATGSLRRLTAALSARGTLRAAGEAGVRVLVDHFAAKESADAHKSARDLGASPSGLYADFAKASSYSMTGTTLVLTIAHAAARQRLEGGTIKPVHSKFLTIPATAEAYGKRASAVGVGLTFAFAYDTAANRWRRALVAETHYERVVSRGKNAGQTARAKKGQKATQGIGKPFFWLVKSVTQKPDPTVLPDDDTLRTGIVDGLRGYADEAIRESGNG